MTDSKKDLNKKEQSHNGEFLFRSEDDKLKEDIMRPPIEKLQLFTKMLRREAMLKKAKIQATIFEFKTEAAIKTSV